MEIREFVTNSINKGIADVAYSLTKDLRRKAQERGWPLNVVLRLRVDIDPKTGAFTIAYPQSVADQVEFLEYGNQDVPPNPVLRPFNNRIEEQAKLYTDDIDASILEGADLW